eukprot:scaffold93030_cov35-Prasinocladus_malaysianus.AAC.1
MIHTVHDPKTPRRTSRLPTKWWAPDWTGLGRGLQRIRGPSCARRQADRPSTRVTGIAAITALRGSGLEGIIIPQEASNALQLPLKLRPVSGQLT